MENESILVSINCITYNHEKYIKDALESFLKQKTNFKFEILIHDDASTDNTADIIREYELKYPDIIKSIIQEENKQSKGIKKISHVYNHTRAKGKYIAMCEGDDYWTDEYKLQKQVNYMESNPGCTFCFHNAFTVNYLSEDKDRKVIPWLTENKNYASTGNRKYSAGELQLLGFIPTASFMFPKYVLDNPPQWFFDAPVGDNAMKLIAASKGYAYYINEEMCVYRTNVPNSSMDKWKKVNASVERKEKKIKRCEDFIRMLDDFNKWSNFTYNTEIDEGKKTWEVQLEVEKNNKSVFNNRRYYSYFKSISLKEKAILGIKCYFPRLIQKLNLLKCKINKK